MRLLPCAEPSREGVHRLMSLMSLMPPMSLMFPIFPMLLTLLMLLMLLMLLAPARSNSGSGTILWRRAAPLHCRAIQRIDVRRVLERSPSDSFPHRKRRRGRLPRLPT